MADTEEALASPEPTSTSTQSTTDTTRGWLPAVFGYVLLPLSGGLIDLAARQALPDLNFAITAVAGTGLVAAFFVAFHGLLWHFLGSRALGTYVTPAQSIKAVGSAFLQPGVLACVLGVLAVGGRFLSGTNTLVQPFRGLRVLLALWAMYTVVIETKRDNAFTKSQVALFVLWLVGLAILFVFSMRVIGPALPA